MTALTLLPAILLMMTAFTRIVIVLGILRQAIGAGQTPPNQVLLGLSLFLTLFVMAPVVDRINEDAVQALHRRAPSTPATALTNARGAAQEVHAATRPGKATSPPSCASPAARASQRPRTCRSRLLVPAFVTSELKTAFMIGFLIFIPFVIIDLVVASVLMSMGMMMLSPVLISLPFKLMLFVLVDGWALVMGTLASSFYT